MGNTKSTGLTASVKTTLKGNTMMFILVGVMILFEILIGAKTG